MNDIYYIKSIPCPSCLQSVTINVLQVINDEEVVLDTVLIMQRSLNLAHLNNILYTDTV